MWASNKICEHLISNLTKDLTLEKSICFYYIKCILIYKNESILYYTTLLRKNSEKYRKMLSLLFHREWQFLMDTARNGIFNFTDFAFLQLLVANGLEHRITRLTFDAFRTKLCPVRWRCRAASVDYCLQRAMFRSVAQRDFWRSATTPFVRSPAPRIGAINKTERARARI